MKLRRWWYLALVAGFVLAILLLAEDLVSGVCMLAQNRVSDILPAAACCVVLVVVNYLIAARIWNKSIAVLNTALPAGTAAAIFLAGNLMRFIPGKIWSWGAQAALAARQAIPAGTSVHASVFSTIYLLEGSILAGSAGISLLLFPWSGAGWVWPAVFMASVVLCLFQKRVLGAVVRLVSRIGPFKALNESPRFFETSVTSLVLSCCAAVVYGIAGWLLALSLGFSSQSALLAGLGVIMGDAAGLLAFISPGGLGVREAVIMFIFSLHQTPIGPDLVLVYSVAFRIMTTLADGLSAVWAGWYLVQHGFRKND